MAYPNDHAAAALAALRQAVAEAPECKRQLGQYAVVRRNGRTVFIGPDAPPMGYSQGAEVARTLGGVAEPGKDD